MQNFTGEKPLRIMLDKTDGVITYLLYKYINIL